MTRTANRPLPAGRLSTNEVLAVGIISAIVGIAWLVWQVNVLTAVVTATVSALAFESVSFAGTGPASVFGFVSRKYVLYSLYLGACAGVAGHTLVNVLLRHLSPLLITMALLMVRQSSRDREQPRPTHRPAGSRACPALFRRSRRTGRPARR